jgi:hypothetical protein
VPRTDGPPPGGEPQQAGLTLFVAATSVARTQPTATADASLCARDDAPAAKRRAVERELLATLRKLCHRRAAFEARLEAAQEHAPAGCVDCVNALAEFGLWAAEPLAELADAPSEKVRTAAFEALWKIPRAPVEVAAERLLAHPAPGLRVAALILLRERRGPAMMPYALAALEDEDQAVRTIAARAVGDYGDAASAEPLTRALRRGFLMGTAHRQQLAVFLGGPIVFVVLLGLMSEGVLLELGVVAAAFSALAGEVVTAFYRRRQLRSEVSLAITEALAKIADRSPTPALRAALPDLRAIAADVVQQEASSRRVSRETAAKIESVTAASKNLPVPAESPAPQPDALPRASAAPAEAAGPQGLSAETNRQR